MALPNPSMNFTPFDVLPASDLNDIVENVEALADGSAFDTTSSIDGRAIDNPIISRAYRTGAHSFTSSIIKVPFETESWDLSNNFNTTTNRFIASTPGYHVANGRVSTSQSSGTHRLLSYLYKNGVEVSRGTDVFAGYFNGSAVLDTVSLATNDYLEIYTLADATLAADVGAPSVNNYFNVHFLSKA